MHPLGSPEAVEICFFLRMGYINLLRGAFPRLLAFRRRACVAWEEATFKHLGPPPRRGCTMNTSPGRSIFEPLQLRFQG